MAKQNQYKTNSSKEEKTSFLKSLKDFFQNERLHNIIGLMFLLTSFYLLIAFTSFLSTGKIDQDKLSSSWINYLFDPEIIAENWLGKLGAWISYLFIHQWFGISSFIFILLFFLLGFKILFKTSLLPLNKTFSYSIFFILWISILLGYIFKQSEWLFLGGAFGYHINGWAITVLGNIGTGLFIVFILLVFLILAFNLSFSKLRKFNKLDNSETPPPSNSIQKAQRATIIDFTIENEDDINDKQDDVEIENDIETDIEEDSSDIQLSIEENADKEEKLSDEEVDSHKSVFTEFDPTLELSSYEIPSIDLLEEYGSDGVNVDREELENNKERIVKTLGNYNISIIKIKATIGPTVTLYEIIPAPGIRISKIKNLEDDIALSLSALGIRIIAPIPGKGTIGIEVPNQNPEMVSMKSLIASDKFQNTNMKLPIALGKTVANETYIADLTKMPHLLMAGATGQGKSVGLNAIITSLLYKKHPSQVKFVLIDPKKVELTLYNKIERHFLAKLPDSEEAIVTNVKNVIHTLNSLCYEMEARLELLNIAEVRNISEYNNKFINRKLNPEKGHRYLPYIVLVIDEFADLIMTAGKEVEVPLTRLAQLARAIGIHLIIATQRPSVNIITGTIKANFPARIAFRVISKIDSRTILDTGGADQLVGRGDMLLSTGSDLIRIQCAFVDTPEVEKITEFIGNQRGYPEAFLLPEYVDDNAQSDSNDIDASERDAMFEEAARIVVQHQQGSASLLQRRLKLGYNRAGRIIDQLESVGIIGPFEGSKARQVLITDEYSLEQFLRNLNEKNSISKNEE